MRVNRKVVIDIASGKVIERDSYQYYGTVAELKGEVEAPPPSQAAQDLQRMQTEVLRTSQAEEEAMRPILYKQMGIERDPTTGEFRQVDTRGELERGFEERALSALRGEIGVSPALEADISKQRETMEENLSRKLGPNWRQTTAGQQAMGELDRRADLVREESRRGMMQTTTGLLGARESSRAGLAGQAYSQLQGAGTGRLALSQGFTGAQAPLLQREAMELEARLGTQAAQESRAGVLTGALGTGATALLTGGTSLVSPAIWEGAKKLLP